MKRKFLWSSWHCLAIFISLFAPYKVIALSCPRYNPDNRSRTMTAKTSDDLQERTGDYYIMGSSGGHNNGKQTRALDSVVFVLDSNAEGETDYYETEVEADDYGDGENSNGANTDDDTMRKARRSRRHNDNLSNMVVRIDEEVTEEIIVETSPPTVTTTTRPLLGATDLCRSHDDCQTSGQTLLCCRVSASRRKECVPPKELTYRQVTTAPTTPSTAGFGTYGWLQNPQKATYNGEPIIVIKTV